MLQKLVQNGKVKLFRKLFRRQCSGCRSKRLFSNVSLMLSNLQLSHCIFWQKDIEMKKKIRNTTPVMFLILIAAFSLTHNDVYQLNINRKQLNICPRTYNRKKWSVPLTDYSNHDVSYRLLISSDIYDIISLDDSLEHLWVEVKDKNEKSPPIWLELSTNLVPKMLRKLNG